MALGLCGFPLSKYPGGLDMLFGPRFVGFGLFGSTLGYHLTDSNGFQEPSDSVILTGTALCGIHPLFHLHLPT